MANFSKKDIYLEAAFLTAIFFAVLFLFIKIDFFDRFYEFTREYEHIQLDEITSALIAFLLACLIFTIRYILKFKKAVIELDRANSELIKYEKEKFNKQKIVALGSLASGLAHEIKNALQPTLGLGQFIREGLTQLGNQKYINYMDIIIDSSTHAHKIIENVLLFASKKEIEFAPENALETIHGTIRFCRDLLPTTIELKTKGLVDNFGYDSEELLINCNQTCFYQIFFNLLNNAGKSINHHGEIDISIEKSHMPKSTRTPSIKVKISDTGCGMDKETVDRIFDPFFSTKDISEGTGLGLTIVKTLVEEHDGDIKVRSRLGEGTTIILNFPILDKNKYKLAKRHNDEI